MRTLLIILLLAAPATCQQQAHSSAPTSSVASQFRIVTYVNLGIPGADQVRYCSDCQPTAPASPGGSGAYCYWDIGNTQWNCNVGAGSGGGGDVTSNTTTSSVGQIAIFSNTSGKQIGRFTGTGWAKTLNGVLSVVPSIDLSTSDVTGNLPITNLNSGTNASSTTCWHGDGTWGDCGSGTGSVTSVGLSAPLGFQVTNTPVTSTGTLTLGYAPGQLANRFLATPNGTTGSLTLRQIAAADVLLSGVTASRCLHTDGTGAITVAAADCATGGTVTSVGLSLPSFITVSNSPVTSTGTLTGTLATQSANTVFSGPTTGAAVAPTFRALVANDIPSITESKFSFSNVTTANSTASQHGLLPILSGNGSDCFRGDGSFATCPGISSGGDFSTNTTVSAAQQVLVAAGTGGKLGTFSTVTGLGSLSSGVLTGVTTSAGISSAISDETGTGFLVFNSSPTIVTPTIASFVNATHNHTNAAGGGQLTLGAFSSTTGSGAVVGATSPTLVTPVLGAATATSINGLTINTTSAALTIASGKTLTVGASLTLAGTDATTMTFPGSSGTVLTADSTATLTNKSISGSQINSGTIGTARLGSGTADTTTFLRGDQTWQSIPGNVPGGSNTQFQFNNLGAFGGASNILYTSATGQVTANQGGNGNNIFYGKRTTDSGQTGNIFLFQNQAASVDLFKVDVNGNMTLNSASGLQDIMTVQNGVQLTSGTQPTCSSSTRGTFWYQAGSTGVKDTVNVCAKDASDNFSWRVIY